MSFQYLLVRARLLPSFVSRLHRNKNKTNEINSVSKCLRYERKKYLEDVPKIRHCLVFAKAVALNVQTIRHCLG